MSATMHDPTRLVNIKTKWLTHTIHLRSVGIQGSKNPGGVVFGKLRRLIEGHQLVARVRACPSTGGLVLSFATDAMGSAANFVPAEAVDEIEALRNDSTAVEYKVELVGNELPPAAMIPWDITDADMRAD